MYNLYTYGMQDVRQYSPQDQLPLRDAGIDFPMTIYRLFSSQFRVAYLLIVREYPGESGPVFARALAHWAKSSSALFGQVLRHCINGEQYFEDLVKMLVVRLSLYGSSDVP